MRGAPPERPAFTLLELLLVLGLILLVVAWVAPDWRRQLAGRRLESAAKELRSVLREARLRAVEDGVAYQFEVVPGTGHYRVRRAAETGARAESPGQGHASIVEGETTDADSWRLESVLSEGFRLTEVQSRRALTQGARGEENAAVSDADGPPPEQAWVSWVEFYPQGTATDAEILLEDPVRELRWQLTVRGLVGRTTITEVSQTQRPASVVP